MKKLMKIFTLFAMVSLLLLAFSGTVQAKTVIFGGVFEIDDESVVPVGDEMNPCDFEVTIHSYGSVRLELSEDHNGYLEFRQFEGQIKVDYYHTPDRTLKARMQGKSGWQDLNEDGSVWVVKSSGPDWLVTIPGYGPVFGSAGLTLFIDTGEEQVYIHDVGLRVFTEPEDYEAFCNYLKPE